MVGTSITPYSPELDTGVLCLRGPKCPGSYCPSWSELRDASTRRCTPEVPSCGYSFGSGAVSKKMALVTAGSERSPGGGGGGVEKHLLRAFMQLGGEEGGWPRSYQGHALGRAAATGSSRTTQLFVCPCLHKERRCKGNPRDRR